MGKNNSAAPAVAAARSGDGQFHFEGFGMNLPDPDFNTTIRKIQFPIEEFLRHGACHATPTKELTALTGLEPRKIAAAVQSARRRGVPILSSTSPGGYFIAETEDERQRCLRSLRHRKQELAWTIFTLERARIEDEDEQEEGH